MTGYLRCPAPSRIWRGKRISWPAICARQSSTGVWTGGWSEIMKETASLEIQEYIHHFRGKAVILDRDLAHLYGVEPRALNQAVKRNRERFPSDFMFQITKEESGSSRSQNVILKKGRNLKYLPYAFTEQGVSMLSAVLNSPKAIEISLHIMRAFVQLRKMLLGNEALRYAIESLEKRM